MAAGINFKKANYSTPTMTTAEINAILSPSEGLVIFNTDIQILCFYGGAIWNKISNAPMSV
tara:strand:- start:1030 stop:1212 length:183 start_codon:yes stop_codon:yes gene_type:complete